jgi:putative endonuclease
VRRVERGYYVYIMASKSRTLYTGVTSDLYKRAFEHKNDLIPGFTTKYRIHRLVHCEKFTNVSSALAREKEIKGWRREKKVALI